MVLHKVCECIQFDKLLTNCFTTGMWIVSYCGTHRANSQPFWGLGSGRKRKGQRERKVTERLSLVRMQQFSVEEEAIFVKSQKCPYHVTFDVYLNLEHTMDACSPGDHRVQVWSQSSHLCRSRSDLRKKFTDGQMDRQTDNTDRPRTPRDCINS